MLRKAIVAGAMICTLMSGTLAGGTAQAGDHTGALLGGIAVGAVGGAIIGSALAQPRPAPVYLASPPPPPRIYAQPVVADGFDDQLFRLHSACDGGNRGACIRFGVLIGEHRERVADWRRSHPDFFTY